MQSIINKLNDRQKDAVVTTEGPVMVMAGAGSGKTRVLTARIAYLINELGIPPYNILAVTFTNKAAREMKERIVKNVDANINMMWVSTFHSICARLLRLEATNLKDYDRNFNIVDEEDAIKYVKDAIKELGLNKDAFKPKSVKSVISEYKNGMIDTIKDNDVRNIYNVYSRLLKEDNLLDFDDLLIVTVNLFKTNPEVLKKYQNKFQYIMIDEFQDTNTIQYELVKLLGLAHQNIFIVGDQDQSIYSFRGAKVENINKFSRDFIGTKVILLEENYRSTQKILDIANKVINNNKDRYKKNLFTNASPGDKPSYYVADNSYDEAMFIMEKIKELKNYDYKDFAIMYRANAISRNFEDVFLKNDIPYAIYGGIGFYQRKEIKDVIAYLKLILNNDDDFSFKRVVNEPKRKIGDALIGKLIDAATDNKVSLFKAIDFIDARGQGYNNLLDFKFTIIELKEKILDENVDINKIVSIIIEKTGYYNMLKEEGDEGADRLENIKELNSMFREFDDYDGTREDKLNSLLLDFALKTDTDKRSENEDCVKLMTFHQAKGLEYPVVFMVAMEQGIFPSQNCFTEKELEEERRICYVGITRAKEKLFITSCRQRQIYGMTEWQYPSIYIREIGEDNLNIIGKTYKKSYVSTGPIIKPTASIPTKTEQVKVSYSLGDKINHKAFGDGTVVAVSGESITVAFGEAFGIKKLLASHPSIRKI